MMFELSRVDQPMIALRFADDLKLGIRLDSICLNSEQIKSAVDQLLTDQSYQNRMNAFSKLCFQSGRPDGVTGSSEIISNYLQASQKKSD